MAEAFKNLINAATVRHAGEHLQRRWPDFDRARFTRIAGAELDTLEFKARAMQLADALEATLPERFAAAADLLESTLAPPLPVNAQGEPVGLGHALSEAGLSGWVLWGAGEYVARRGMDDVPRALACLHAITQRFTAEFAIRPFIDQHPEQALPILARWVHDPSPHVRRLVSEGSRPRLPWGLRLQRFVADPAPTLPLLISLQDDSSAYVRRSVANHLNDIAKDHPEQVADWLKTHLPSASPTRKALLRHASRSLIKQGHASTLQAWGLDQAFEGSAVLTLDASKVAMGASVSFQAELVSMGTEAQSMVIDYVVHHVRANGSSAPKVFKGWKPTIAPGQRITLRKTHSLRPVSTRRLYPGLHRIDLQINGRLSASASFDLLPAPAATS